MFKQTVVVMLSGRAGTGKTTSAKYLNSLAQRDKLESEVYSFGFPLKQVAKIMGWDGKKDERGRKLLQDLGTEVGRTYDEDMWCKLLFQHIESGSIYDVIFIDDWRFLSELAFVKSRFPYVPVTIRLSFPEKELLKGTPNYNHISEISLPERPESNLYDYIIEDSFEDVLRKQLDSIWESIKYNINYYYEKKNLPIPISYLVTQEENN